jgi:hypothetical protein
MPISRHSAEGSGPITGIASHNPDCLGGPECRASKPACVSGRGQAHHFILTGSRPNSKKSTPGACLFCGLKWIFADWDNCRFLGYDLRPGALAALQDPMSP